MNRDDFFLFGNLLKTHGINGEFLVKFHVDRPEDFELMESVFIDFDGQLIPFFISDYGLRFTARSSGIIKFDAIESEERARLFVNCDLYQPNDMLTEVTSDFMLENLIGFTLTDPAHGKIGTISDVFYYPGNPVIQILGKKGEILIPFSPDILIGIDEENQIIDLNIPDGLLDIYM